MCRCCGKPYTETAGPQYASAIPGLCLACVAEHFDADHWLECWPIGDEEFAVPFTATLADGTELSVLLDVDIQEESVALIAASPEVKKIERTAA